MIAFWLMVLRRGDPTADRGSVSLICLCIHQRTSNGRVVNLMHITAQMYLCPFNNTTFITPFLEAGESCFPKQLGLQWARSFSALPNLANLLLPKLTASSLGLASCQVDSLQDPAWFHAGLGTGQSVEWEGGLNYFQATECGWVSSS